MTEPQKVSSSQLFDRFNQLESLTLRPREWLLYKPNPKGTGAALKLQCSVFPAFEEGYTRTGSGGVFATIAKQNGERSFDWSGAVTVKFDSNDLGAFVAGLEALRRGLPMPVGLAKPDQPSTIARFHKFEEVNTIIALNVTDRGSFFGIHRGNRYSISMTMAEEVVFLEYAHMCLRALLTVGL